MERARYIPDYRAAEAQQVKDWTKVGQSGNLVGLRGASKSKFVRLILCQDIQRHYLEQTCTALLFVPADLPRSRPARRGAVRGHALQIARAVMHNLGAM
jgi:hypothetical protein